MFDFYPRARKSIIRGAALGLAILICQALSASAVAQQQDTAYPPPRTPTLLDASAPSFAPLDAEVDSFVQIPQARAKFNVSGKGLAVAVIDTGANPKHICFQGQLLPGMNFSTAGGPDDTTDFDGHGSNVAGIIAAKQVAAIEGMPLGIAPDAKIIPLKVFPGGSKLTAALQFVLDNIDKYKTDHGVTIGVVNMSLGTKQNLQDLSGSNPQDFLDQRDRIAKLRARNIVVTVAAGNYYFAFNPGQGMGFPAICPETLSVGAVYDKNIGPNDDGSPLVTFIDGAKVFQAVAGRCTVFSQRLGAGTDSNNPFRTDIFSPGFIVTSMGPVPPASSGQDPTRTRTTDDGTSQASPVTAGVALLLQEHWRNRNASAGGDPGLPSVDLVEKWMRNGGVPFQDVDDRVAQEMGNVKSSGASFIRLNAIGALAQVDPTFGTSNLQNLQIQLIKKPKEQPATLEKAGIKRKDQ
jgi:subtilisin family serine protease